MTLPVCVIGAGSSGLVAAKVLAERGIPFDAFEIGSAVGGLWRYENDNGRAAAYASLEANTSRDKTAFACFPMPEDYPAYPGHAEMAEYLDAFADRFSLREAIEFRTRVVRVARATPDAAGDPAGFEVTVRRLGAGAVETRSYAAVLVASGHHWDASWPDFPGGFGGTELHSHDYRTPDLFAGRRALVVGIGNSACDIACEAAGVAERTLLSTRRSAHVLPKWLLGRPLDAWLGPLASRLPVAVQSALFKLLVRLDRGDQEAYGIPEPAHPFGAEHPTISSRLPELVREGLVSVKGDVERLLGEAVRFEDGSEEPVDVIVYATGYRISFPFLDPPLLDAMLPGEPPSRDGRIPGNRLPLYLHVVPPEVRGLYFIGLVQPLGAIMPLAEAQSEWVADLLEGRAALPSPARMHAWIDRTERRLQRRFVRSRRHTMEVDFYPYLREVRRARRAGCGRSGLDFFRESPYTERVTKRAYQS